MIAYPTEGVWGLGCFPENVEAVARILELKQRSWEQGLILVAGHISQVDAYLGEITDQERAILDANWPGPVTFLVPDRRVAPEWIRGKFETVALRVSAHPIVQAICGELKGPIVSTSANPHGKKPAVSLLRLRQYFPPDHIARTNSQTSLRIATFAALKKCGLNYLSSSGNRYCLM